MARIRSRERAHDGVETQRAAAARDLLARLGGSTPKKLVTSVRLVRSAAPARRGLNRALREHLPKHTRLIGATTGGEVDNGGIHRDSVVLSALSGDFERRHRPREGLHR